MDKNLFSDLLLQEKNRQATTIPLIASENFAYPEVQKIVGSCLMNKYAEGYPGKRYYQGNKVIDQIETQTVQLAKDIFGFEAANVQAYSGSPANSAVLMALAGEGEKIAGLKLSAGGHLTHGHPKVTFSGSFYDSVQMEVDSCGRIDKKFAEELILREKPRVIFLGTTSYPYFLDFEWMAGLAEKVGAYLVADIAHISALVIAGLHPNPMAWADVVTMTTHKQLRGPRGAIIGVSKKGLAKDPDLAKKIDRAVFPGLQGGPHMETVAGIGVCLQRAKTEEFRAYAQQIIGNAKALETTLRKSGLAVFGTENHLMVVGVGEGRGRIAAEKLEEAGLVVNANSIPWDRAKPFSPSGIRLGTPAVSSLGMKEQEMELVGQWVADLILEKREPKEILPLVLELRKKFEI